MGSLAGCSLTTEAGLERTVPATKSFTTQLRLVYLLARRVRGKLTEAEAGERLEEVVRLAELVEKMLPAWEVRWSRWFVRLGR